MSLSFLEVWERMVIEDVELNQDPPLDGHDPLMSSGQDSRAMQVVRAGMNLRNPDDPAFWDDFMNLCSNSQGMAELLGVKESEIRTWSSKIRDIIRQVEEMDQSNPEGENDQKVMSTGDGAMTSSKMMQHAGGIA